MISSSSIIDIFMPANDINVLGVPHNFFATSDIKVINIHGRLEGRFSFESTFH